jgi:hypothetical protein
MAQTGSTGYGRAWLYLFATSITIYAVMGILTMVDGKGASAAWLNPLPILIGPLIGIGIVRYRRQRAERL